MSCTVVRLGPTVAAFVCRIPEETLETYGMAPTKYEMEQGRIMHNKEQDMRREAELADEHIACLVDDWPWYADSPCEVQEPEVFGP